MNWGRIGVGAMILVPLAAMPVGFLATRAETPFHWFLVVCLAVLLAGILHACLHVIGRDSKASVIEDIIDSLGRMVAKWRSYFPGTTATGTAKPAWKTWLTVLASMATIGGAGYTFWQGSRGPQPPPPPGPESPPGQGDHTPPKPDIRIERKEVPQAPAVITRSEWLGVTGEADSIPSSLVGTVQINVDNKSFGTHVAKDKLIDPEELVWWPCVTRSRVVQLDKRGVPEEYDLHAAFLADFRELTECERTKADELGPAQHVPSQGIRLSSAPGQNDSYETKPILGGEQAQDFDIRMAITVEALGPNATIGLDAYGVGFQWVEEGRGASITGWRKTKDSDDFEAFRQVLDLKQTWSGDRVVLRVRRHGSEVKFFFGQSDLSNIKWTLMATGMVPPDLFRCDNRSLNFHVKDASIVVQSALAFGIESERLFKPEIDALKTRFWNELNSPRTSKSLAQVELRESPLVAK